MKFIILAVVAIVAVASALPVEKEVEILNSTNEQNPDGGFAYGFETSDGTKREETGVVKETVDEENKPTKVVVVRGSYSYINSDGNQESITYTADEEGFHPEGPSIPVAPVARR